MRIAFDGVCNSKSYLDKTKPFQGGHEAGLFLQEIAGLGGQGSPLTFVYPLYRYRNNENSIQRVAGKKQEIRE